MPNSIRNESHSRGVKWSGVYFRKQCEILERQKIRDQVKRASSQAVPMGING